MRGVVAVVAAVAAAVVVAAAATAAAGDERDAKLRISKQEFPHRLAVKIGNVYFFFLV